MRPDQADDLTEALTAILRTQTHLIRRALTLAALACALAGATATVVALSLFFG